MTEFNLDIIFVLRIGVGQKFSDFGKPRIKFESLN